MTEHFDIPERQSRARRSFSEVASTEDNSWASRPVAPVEPPAFQSQLDLERLRASTAAAMASEAPALLSGFQPAALAPPSGPRPAPPVPPKPTPTPTPLPLSAPASGTPRIETVPLPAAPMQAPVRPPIHQPRRWVKFALPVALLAAVATVGLVVGGGQSDTTTSTAPGKATAGAGAASKTTTSALAATTTTAAVTTTGAAETTTTAAAPTTTAAAAAAPASDTATPAHKAVYRGGKLYLEGKIPSQEVADQYIAKAAAVLGAENVVNNYTIDPSVAPTNDGTVYVDEPFLFEPESAAINPTYAGVLGLGIAALKLNPAARMVVTGYTDTSGDPQRNLELSQQRASAVVDYMVATGELDRTRFDAIGAGDTNPVADNSTPEGRTLNRRIDVKLVNLLG